MLRVKHCISVNLNQVQFISIVDTYLTLQCARNVTVHVKQHDAKAIDKN